MCLNSEKFSVFVDISISSGIFHFLRRILPLTSITCTNLQLLIIFDEIYIQAVAICSVFLTFFHFKVGSIWRRPIWEFIQQVIECFHVRGPTSIILKIGKILRKINFLKIDRNSRNLSNIYFNSIRRKSLWVSSLGEIVWEKLDSSDANLNISSLTRN